MGFPQSENPETLEWAFSDLEHLDSLDFVKEDLGYAARKYDIFLGKETPLSQFTMLI